MRSVAPRRSPLRTITRRLGVAVGLGTVLLALETCAGRLDRSALYSLDEIAWHADALEHESDVHRSEVTGKESVAEVAATEPGHDARADEHLGAIDEMLGELDACRDGAGAPPATRGVRSSVDAIHAELARHARAIAEAPSMRDAMADESDHARYLVALVGRLREGERALEPIAGAYTCPSCDFCNR